MNGTIEITQDFRSSLLIILSFILASIAQAQEKLHPDKLFINSLFQDDFENPSLDKWSSSEAYTVINKMLRVRNNSSSPTHIKSKIVPAYGMMYELGFSTEIPLTSSTFFRFYLSADNLSLTNDHQGYHLQVDGASGLHTYKLYRQQHTSRTLIFQSRPIPSPPGVLSAQLKISRDQLGYWKILVKTPADREYVPLSNFTEHTLTQDLSYPLHPYIALSNHFIPEHRSSLSYHYIRISPYSSENTMTLHKAEVIKEDEILLTFSDFLDSTQMKSPSHYQLSPAIPVNRIHVQDSTVRLSLDKQLDRQGVQLRIKDVTQFTGLTFALDSIIKLSYTPPYHAQLGDIIINEVLFNPRQGGVDFVEIYNNSAQEIDLTNWTLGKYAIVDTIHRIPSGSYRYITTNTATIQQHYPNAPEENAIQLAQMPSYPNERGTVTLYYQNRMIDSLNYSHDMHAPFVSNPKGISLERESSTQPTNAPGNFRSSATIGDGATPGYKNSQADANYFKKNTFFLSTRTFSPDGDSREDLLEINYEIMTPNAMINMTVFNDKGRIINRLIRNKSIVSSGTIHWDGRDENSQLSAPGIYLYMIELYDNQGLLRTFRGSFVLASTQ